MKHRPTGAMVATAKQAIKRQQEKSIEGLDEAAVVARKIASGADLSEVVVRRMADLYAQEDSTTAADRIRRDLERDMLSGEAGELWVASQIGALDRESLGDDDRDLMAAISDPDRGVSLEIYVRNGLDEPVLLSADNDGLIWAPILRSGTLAVRPGPNGEKVKQPLRFVAGRSTDQKKEIGLQDIVDAFEAGAIQEVTIPTTHENNVLDNTGFIRKLKIVESKRRPGESVLVAAHDFTEPDVRGRVERGSVGNRSCGLLYDYVNTETGRTWPVALEHVALTNRPWVTGMTPYGELSDGFAADRDVFPMLLSDGSSSRSPAPSSRSWDGSASRFTDEQYVSSCLIKGRGKSDSHLPVREPEGKLNAAAVHSAAGRIHSLRGVSDEQKRSAAKTLVGLYSKLGEEAPDALKKLAAVSTRMSEQQIRSELLLADVAWGDRTSMNWVQGQVTETLRSLRRGADQETYGAPYYYVMDVQMTDETSGEALVRIDYGMSGCPDDAWVVPWRTDRRNDDQHVILADFSEWTAVEQKWVIDPQQTDDQAELDELFNSPDPSLSDLTPLQRASARRRGAAPRPASSPIPGGPTMFFSEQEMERLGLSDEAKEALRKKQAQFAQQEQEMSALRARARADRVTARITELKGMGFEALPGVLREVELLYQSDDGDVAATLKLSENGVQTTADVTITQIVDRVIGSFPMKDGKVDLSQVGNALTSPISTRPPQDPEAPGGDDAPKDGDAMLAEWAKADPSLRSAFAEAGLTSTSTTTAPAAA